MDCPDLLQVALPKTQIKQNKIEFQQNTLLLSYLTYTQVHGHISTFSCTAYGMAHGTWPIAATNVGPGGGGGGAARRRLRGRPPGRPRKAFGPINVPGYPRICCHRISVDIQRHLN